MIFDASYGHADGGTPGLPRGGSVARLAPRSPLLLLCRRIGARARIAIFLQDAGLTLRTTNSVLAAGSCSPGWRANPRSRGLPPGKSSSALPSLFDAQAGARLSCGPWWPSGDTDCAASSGAGQVRSDPAVVVTAIWPPSPADASWWMAAARCFVDAGTAPDVFAEQAMIENVSPRPVLPAFACPFF